ncbi:MAG: hypothetical protein E6H48_01555 [Betaproteobacteria bacterium]|nr:MAG: hypothetical protein E6H48_01555 [Betaproteobacteria bacterium]
MVDYQPSLLGNARKELTRFQAIFRFGLSALLFAGALHGSVAWSTVRAGDATYVDELQRHATAMASLEEEFLSSIDSASERERFNPYRTYNQLMGSWLQVDLVEALLAASIEAAPTCEEETIRTTLRDQAEFARAELDHAVVDLEHNVAAIKRYDHLRLNNALRSLLSSVRATVDRMIIDQRPPSPCGTGP